jgi:hypothetical protein
VAAEVVKAVVETRSAVEVIVFGHKEALSTA